MFEASKVTVSAKAPAVQGTCPCCGAVATQTIYRADGVPVHSCVLLDTPQAALEFPKRNLELAFCAGCGFVFNRIFDENVMGYSTNFEESQHFSDTFNAFARQIARETAEKCNISGKHVLEIGCGKGEFLRELCSVGGASGLGIDPGYRADAGRSKDDGNVQFITDFFSSKYRDLSADVILCRHTLEHISPVSSFIRSIREMIGKRPDVWVVFETPDAKRVLSEGAFWDIYYEHCSYFSPGCHARLFRQEGFDVTDLTLCYDDQYIYQYAKPVSGVTSARFPLEQDLAEMRSLAAHFQSHVENVKQYWRELIRSAWNDGRRVAIWGGGSKGVSFLTTLGLTKEIDSVVDVNPYKQGKFMPGTAHPVISPKALRDKPPDLVIVMNPIYVKEITSSLNDLGLAPEIIGLEPIGAGSCANRY
jgi:SAM-dependent methyltransferase